MDALEDGSRGLTTAMRVVLVVFLALAGLAFVLLYLRGGHTDREFAWTVRPPVTAAFLGAGYGAGCVLVAASLRRRPWAEVRVGIGIVLVFTAMMLVATLLHLERFHFGAASGGIARFAAWVFLAVYVVAPTVGTWLFVREQRRAGPQPPGGLALPGWFKLAVGAQGGLMAAFGAALFVAPWVLAPAWPWVLTSVAYGLLQLGAAAVIDASRDPVASRQFDQLIDVARIVVAPVTEQQARIARAAYRDFGKGSGHPAGLNLGDCFAYALAKDSGEPLLFKGRDFVQTDIVPALRLTEPA